MDGRNYNMQGRKGTMIHQWEIDFIKRHYLEYSVTAMGVHLNRSDYIIRFHMRKEKLIVPKEIKMKRLPIFGEKKKVIQRERTLSEYEKTLQKYLS